MRHRTWVVFAAALALGGCHTITEDLPTKPSNTGNLPTVNVPVPVVVTPVEIPVATPAPQTPSNPAPNPPTPPGGEEPTPDGDGADIPDNNAPVAKLVAKVFFVECGSGPVAGSGGATEAPVGCRVHLDVTAKDSSGQPTRARNEPRWTFSDPGLVQVGGTPPYNPTLLVKAPGVFSAFAQVDGVRSNELHLRFN